jgi:opacity protein-like surface antigen
MKRPATCVLVCLFALLTLKTNSQETDRSWLIGVFGGLVNYQGDLKPTSFTFQHSNPAFAVTIRKPLGRWLSFKSGVAIGKVEGADRDNRDYLRARNLSFYSNIKEFNAGLELNVLDITTKSFSPYLYGGISVFHFNPWTYDQSGQKVYLQPLGTEGQGLQQYSDRKPYKLWQPALAFGAGARFAINENVNIGIEFSQRKSFTDYLDDVSTQYADHDILLSARGAKTAELAFRGDEIPGGSAYPHTGEQRGTPSEMDWYYFFGVTLEIKLSSLGKVFRHSNSSHNYIRCPKLN